MCVYRCIEESPQDIVIDAVFDKDEGVVALDGVDSDTDGYLPEVLFLTFSRLFDVVSM